MVARSAFAALLYACPPAFRREYGRAMRRDFADALREERLVHGALGAIAFALGAYYDVLATAAREYVAMIFRDLVFAFRALRKTPVFAAVVVATLALAIGANAGVFSILRAVVLAPLPYADPAMLVAVQERGADRKFFSLSLPDFIDLRAQSTSLTGAAAFARTSATLTGRGRPEKLNGATTTDGLFETLGARPELGRFFVESDLRPGAPAAVVISDGLWRQRLQADSQAVGSRLVLDGTSYRIVGIAPATFAQPELERGFMDAAYWLPLQVGGAGWADERDSHHYKGVARLRPGVSPERANAEFATISDRLARRYADHKRFGFIATPLDESLVGSVRPTLFAVFAAVAVVLLVACANVANLLLSRAASRSRELAVRVALGASRGRIVGQLLTETFVLTAAGGLIGLALGFALVQGFVGLHPRDIPRVNDVVFDAPAALYTLGSVAFCTLAAGLAPALASTRPRGALKAAGRGGDASGGARARNVLVTAEVALTLALVVAAGLVVRSFVTLTHEPLGFAATDVAVVDPVDLPNARYPTNAANAAFYERAQQRVAALPGAVGAAWTFTPPFANQRAMTTFTVSGRPAVQPGDEPAADFRVIGPTFFEVLRIPVLRGRAFTASDRAGSHPVVVVNEAFVKAYLAPSRVLGTRLTPGVTMDPGKPPERTVVGVVADTRDSYALAPAPAMYIPLAQVPLGPEFLVVRSAPGKDVAPAAAAAITALDSMLPLPPVKPFAAYLAADTARTRLSVFALGTLALVALALAVAGIYAIVSFGVTQRTHEFGVRMALGARGSHIVRNVMAGALRTAVLGMLLGLVCASIAARLLADQLYEVPALDPLTFAVVLVLIAGASLAAALLPARRATRVDPIVALRYE